jgi:hypothetical protein
MVVCPKITLCWATALLPALRTNQPIRGTHGRTYGMSLRMGKPPEYRVGSPRRASDSNLEISRVCRLLSVPRQQK